MAAQGCTTRLTVCNGPTCFKCREQGHTRLECRERVYCTLCRTHNHDTKACRKQHNNIPSPTNSHLTTGYHPTETPPPLIGTTMAPQQSTRQAPTTADPYSRIFLKTTNQEPALQSTHCSMAHHQHHQST